MAGDAARTTVNALVSDIIRGELAIGRIDVLSVDRVVAHHVSVYDADGARVLYAREVVVIPDIDAALMGVLRFRHAEATDVKLRLLTGETAVPTFIDAFGPVDLTPSTGPGLHAIVEDIHLANVEAYGRIVDLNGVRLHLDTLRGRLEANGPLVVQIYGGTGLMTEPYPFVGHIEALSGTINTDPQIGIDVRSRGYIERQDGPTDRLSAQLVYRVPEGGGPLDLQELDLLVEADPIDARAIREVGFDWGSLLLGPMRGHLRFSGPSDHFVLRSTLESAGGPVGVRVDILPSQVDSHIWTSGVDLARIVENAPELHVGGRARLRIDSLDPNALPQVTLDVEPFLWDELAIPSFTLEGELLEGAVRIDEVRSMYEQEPNLGGTIHGSGLVTFEPVAANVDVEAHIPQIAADPNIHHFLPDARGRLDASLHVAADALRYDVRGTYDLRNFRYSVVAASALHARGSIVGDTGFLPQVDLRVSGSGASISGYPLGTADLTVRGGPTHYALIGRFREGERRLDFDARMDARDGYYEVDAERIELAVADLVWRGELRHVHIVPGSYVDVEKLLLANGPQRLEASGRYRNFGSSHLDAQAQAFDLTGLRPFFGDDIPDVRGQLDAHLALDGPLSAPNVVLEGGLHNGEMIGLSGLEAVYSIQYEDQTLAVDTQIDVGLGTLALTGSGVLDTTMRSLEDQLLGGVYEVDVTAANLSIDDVRRVASDAIPAQAGVVAGTVHLEGPLLAPSLEGNLMIPGLTLEGWPSLAVITSFDYESGALVARLQLGDELGDLFETEVSLVIDLVNLALHPAEAVASLESLPWRASVRVPPRLLQDMPLPVRSAVPRSFGETRIGGSATLAGGGFETRADVDVFAEYVGDDRALSCGATARPRVQVRATLRDDLTEVHMLGFLGRRAVLDGVLAARTPIDEWLTAGRVPSPPPMNATVRLNQAPLELMPSLCLTGRGPIDGSLVIENLFTDQPLLHGELNADSVNFAGTTSMQASASFDAQGDTLRADANAAFAGGGQATVNAQLPIGFGVADPYPRVVASRRLHGEALFEDTPIGPFLTWVPGFDDIVGFVNGTASVDGTRDAIAVEGDVRLANGAAEVVSLGQQLEDIEGVVTLEGRTITLRGLTANDGDGSVRIGGTIELEGLSPRRSRLDIRADKFPVRNEGSILARLTGGATVDADISDSGMVIAASVNSLSVGLPDQSARSLQPLEPHPDVHTGEEEEEEARGEDPYTVAIQIDASQPFWVRRNDFSVQVSAMLRAVYEDPDFRVTGAIDVRRGFYDVFGKRFELERGSMTLDGGQRIDPEVDIVAVHQLRGTSNTITVTVSGRLSALDIQFTSNVATDQGEIISLLVGGARGANQNASTAAAQEQTQDFVLGLFAGILTLSLRQSFGTFVPVIAVEADRARAGLPLDRFIPAFLRDVVQGVYVEGQVPIQLNQNDQTQVGQTGLGFLLELQFPYNIVQTTTFNSQNWSVDVTWEP